MHLHFIEPKENPNAKKQFTTRTIEGMGAFQIVAYTIHMNNYIFLMLSKSELSRSGEPRWILAVGQTFSSRSTMRQNSLGDMNIPSAYDRNSTAQLLLEFVKTKYATKDNMNATIQQPTADGSSQ